MRKVVCEVRWHFLWGWIMHKRFETRDNHTLSNTNATTQILKPQKRWKGKRWTWPGTNCLVTCCQHRTLASERLIWFFENFSCQQMDMVRRRSYPALTSRTNMLFAVVTLVYALALGNATSRIWYSPPSVFATKCCPPTLGTPNQMVACRPGEGFVHFLLWFSHSIQLRWPVM